MRYVKLAPGSDGPLCPNDSGPTMHPAHAFRSRMLDAAYEASDRDEDGEYTEPAAERMYQAIAYSDRVDYRMQLFVSTVAAEHQSALPVIVEAWFFRCPTCGLILPAGRRP